MSGRSSTIFVWKYFKDVHAKSCDGGRKSWSQAKVTRCIVYCPVLTIATNIPTTIMGIEGDESSITKLIALQQGELFDL